MARRALFAGLLCFVQVLVCGTSYVWAEDEAETLKQIRAAWTKRRDAITTFHYLCALEEVKTVVHGKTDLFGEAEDPAVPKVNETFRKALTYSFDRGKLAYSLEGEEWSEIKQAKAPYTFRVSFDGRGNRSLLQHSGPARGQFDHLGKPDDQLVVNFNQTAFWLAYDPEAHFQRLGYDPDRTSILQRGVPLQGRECLELHLPRNNADWKGLLYLDIAHDFLPMRFVQELKGDIRSEIEIEYRRNDRIGWVVTGWTRKQFGSPEEIPETSNGAVLECRVNEELKNGVFAVKFPVGALLTEETNQGRRYFKQMKDGSLKPISERERYAPSRSRAL